MLCLLARKLENWEDAATDAEIAQEIDPRNVKVGFSGLDCYPAGRIREMTRGQMLSEAHAQYIDL